MINIEYKAEYNSDMVDLDSFLDQTGYRDRYSLLRALDRETTGVTRIRRGSTRGGRAIVTQYWIGKATLKQWANERNFYSLLKELVAEKPVADESFFVEDHKAIAESYQRIYNEQFEKNRLLQRELKELRLRNWFQRLFNISPTK